MPAALQKVSFTFRDAKNQTARMTFIIGDTTPTTIYADAATLKGHLQALSNAHVQIVATDYTDTTTGTAAVYGSVEDKAVFTFQDADGVLHRWKVPAPKTAIFQADGETVDFSVTAVNDFKTDMLAFIYDQDGVQITSSVGGTRARVKAQRRFNVRTRNPALTGQGL